MKSNTEKQITARVKFNQLMYQHDAFKYYLAKPTGVLTLLDNIFAMVQDFQPESEEEKERISVGLQELGKFLKTL